MDEIEISVGICAHNERETIGVLLEEIMDEDIPINEIIVVVAGDDGTASIVEKKMDKYEEIVLIEEDSRKGQIVAQNKILEKSDSEAILLTDADGTLKKGSLEALHERFNGENVVSGKEIPVTDNSFIGKVIDFHGEVHNNLCLINPRFSTHIGIFPSKIIDSFPEIILDDIYIEDKCISENIRLEYEPDAVKYHHTPNEMYFFYSQQKKNWAGRFQAEEKGFNHTKPELILLKAFFRELDNDSYKKVHIIVSLVLLETLAYFGARLHQITRDFPIKWHRPVK